MAKDLMPASDLNDPRNIAVPEELHARLSLFASLKPAPSLDKFPGSVVLRRYPKGDVICRQGEAGWTAFYLLPAKDLAELRSHPRKRLGEIPQEKARAQEALDKARLQLIEAEKRLQNPQLAAKEK